jgi:pyrophosphatase PpaX
MIKAVIFDVDGVLLDSFDSNLEFYSDLMKNFGYNPPSREEYKSLFFLPLREVVVRLSGLKDEDKIEEIIDWGKNYPLDSGVKIGSSVLKIVSELKGSYKLGIVTSRMKHEVFEGEMEKIKSFFDVVISYEDTSKHKPHPEPLVLAAKNLGFSVNQCVYVGDALTDVAAANACGMKVIFYGELKPQSAYACTSEFRQIPKIISSIA